MGASRHLLAFNRSVRTRGIESDELRGPLVLLGRDLARDLDFLDDSPRRRDKFTLYRSVLKQLGLLAPASRDVEHSRSEMSPERPFSGPEMPTSVTSIAPFLRR